MVDEVHENESVTSEGSKLNVDLNVNRLNSSENTDSMHSDNSLDNDPDYFFDNITIKNEINKPVEKC